MHLKMFTMEKINTLRAEELRREAKRFSFFSLAKRKMRAANEETQPEKSFAAEKTNLPLLQPKKGG